VQEKLALWSDPVVLHEQVNKFFVQFDESKDGFLDRKELRHFMEAFFKEYHIHLPLNDDFVHSLFN
jgi:Ca2+-binding EF-hand superfamily protein